MTDYPPAQITLGAPHYGPFEDKFPGTLFTTFDGMLRLIRETDSHGKPLWRIQRRTSNVSTSGAWMNLFFARSRDDLWQALRRFAITDPAITAFVQTQLPYRAI